MSGKGEHICRLCLQVAKTDSEEVDNLVEQMLEALLLKLELRLTRDPIICRDCLEVAKKCLIFKSTCIGVEQIILSFSAVSEDIKPSIKVIFRENNEHAVAFADEDLNICRFCLTRLDRNNFVLLGTLMTQAMFDILQKYIPEMDLNFIENPIICPSCGENLENYFKFVQHSLDIERKIKAYEKEERTDSRGQVKLSNIGQFSFKDILEYSVGSPEIYSFKEESNIFEDTECVYPKAYSDFMRLEDELGIKEENSCKTLPEMMFDKEHTGKATADSNKIYKCSLCAYENKRKSRITNEHMLVHKDISEVETYKCALCAFETKQKRYLKRHMLVHKKISEIKTYKCPFCAYESKRKYVLKKHMLIHKDISNKKMYKCSLCAYENQRRSRINAHMLVHKDISEIERYKCSLCPFETKQKCYLKTHMLVHKNISEIKTYRCSLCTYECKRKEYLKKHMFVHKDISNVKMHKCSLCAFETRHKRYVHEHVMLVHKNPSAIKRHRCSLCASEFKRKSDLNKHMLLIHKDISEIKMHKCSLCAVETKRKADLESHMLIHKDISEVNMHRCSLCSFETKWKNSLKKHMLTHKENDK